MTSVLLVDDSRDQSRALCALLRRAGVGIEYVESGNAALAFLDEHPVRVVLLDAMMPDVSGWDVLRILRSQHRFDDVYVLMYSAVDDPEWNALARAIGADDYLVKTKVGLVELRAAVKKCLGTPRSVTGPS